MPCSRSVIADKIHSSTTAASVLTVLGTSVGSEKGILAVEIPKRIFHGFQAIAAAKGSAEFKSGSDRRRYLEIECCHVSVIQ
jgi:hypothetical protein